MKKRFSSTIVLLSFKKTISVNTGVIHKKNEIKSTKRRDNTIPVDHIINEF